MIKTQWFVDFDHWAMNRNGKIIGMEKETSVARMTQCDIYAILW